MKNQTKINLILALTLNLFIGSSQTMKHSPSSDNVCSLQDIITHKEQFRLIMVNLVSFKDAQEPYKTFVYSTTALQLNNYCKLHFKTGLDLLLVLPDFSQTILELGLTNNDITYLLHSSKINLSAEYLCHKFLNKKDHK